jgi:DNA-binding response OmpR family regulator
MSPSLAPIRTKTRRIVGHAVVAVSDPTQAQLVECVLRRLGWAAVRVASAAEVRERLAETPGAVVILGTALADESGWLTCAKLAHPAGRTKVLIVAPDTPLNRMQAHAAGATALLADPVEISEWV